MRIANQMDTSEFRTILFYADSLKILGLVKREENTFRMESSVNVSLMIICLAPALIIISMLSKSSSLRSATMGVPGRFWLIWKILSCPAISFMSLSIKVIWKKFSFIIPVASEMEEATFIASTLSFSKSSSICRKVLQNQVLSITNKILYLMWYFIANFLQRKSMTGRKFTKERDLHFLSVFFTIINVEIYADFRKKDVEFHILIISIY